MLPRRVVVSGLGAVSAFGAGIPPYWDAISNGKTGASLVTTFDASRLPTRFAGEVKLDNGALDGLLSNRRSGKTLSRAGKMAVIAAQEATLAAELRRDSTDPYRVGASLGSGGVGLWDLEHSEQLLDIIAASLKPGDADSVEYATAWKKVLTEVNPLTTLKALPNIPTSQISIEYNARGPCLTVTTACTSSAQAIGEAFRLIRSGEADVMITGGSDSMVNPYGLVAFSMLGVMSKNNEEWATAARPFDKTRDGFMLGEGAAIAVLEEAEHCLSRGATPLAEVLGYASTCDAYRLTDEPPEAWGSIQAIKQALNDATVHPSRVDYVNAHGTGTQMNDVAETHAIKTVLGAHAYAVPVSSTKSMIGHLVAAAGAIEFVTCVLSLQHQVVTPTINLAVADDRCDLDYVPNQARSMPIDVVLSNSSGFGGQNACLVLGKFHERPQRE